MERNIYKDFDIFSRALIASDDVDPVYPVIRKIVNHYNLQPEWFTFMYVLFYNLESAIEICKVMPTMSHWNPEKFIELRNTIKKFGHERRGMIRIVMNEINALNHVIRNFKIDKNDNNRSLRTKIESYPFHGSWAAFKIAEIFEKSFEYSNLGIHDLGIDDKDVNRNDGPVGGLRWLYGREYQYDNSFKSTWNKFGKNLSKAWGVDIGKTETCLCKWHKTISGKYYIGNDVSEFHELKHVLGDKNYNKIIIQTFPEFKEITGVDKSLKGLYKREDKLTMTHLVNKLPEADVLQILLDS